MQRSKTNNFEELNYTLVKTDNKSIAVCNLCKQTLNTASNRLIMHRQRCQSSNSTHGGVGFSELEKVQTEDRMSVNKGSDNYTLKNGDGLDVKNKSVSSEHKAIKKASEQPENLSVSLLRGGSPLQPPEFYMNQSISTSSSTLSPQTAGSLIFSASTSQSVFQSQSFEKVVPPGEKLSQKSKEKNQIVNFVGKTNPTEKDELDSVIAKFFYGCNISLNTIESVHFQTMIKALKPSYAKLIPSRKILSTKLLDETYQACLNEARSFKSSDSVLLIDGWKNSSSNSRVVVSMVQNVNGHREFVNAWDLNGESKTADVLSNIASESIDLAKQLYGTNIYAIVSDNASAVAKLGQNVKYILWHSTCNCHTGNLLARDIIDQKLAESVYIIQREFKNTDFETIILKNGGKRIKLSNVTRWCSHRDSYENFLNNLQYMKQIITDGKPKKVKEAVCKLIFDDDFIEKIKEEKELLDPVCDLINFCQSPSASLADAAKKWLNFKLHEKFRVKMQKKVQHRQSMALNEYALTAYYLHPFYDNELLSNVQIGMVNNFLLRNLTGEGIEDWHDFKKRYGLFGMLYQKNIKKPHVFWSTAEIKHPHLSKLALKLLSIPAASAQIEKVFSNWAQIHINTPLRNRLSFERSKKLIHIYFALNGKRLEVSPVDFDEEDNCDDEI